MGNKCTFILRAFCFFVFVFVRGRGVTIVDTIDLSRLLQAR